MRIVLTGAFGTVGPKLHSAATSRGHEIITWDRHAVDPNDPAAVDAFVRAVRPHAIAHVGMGAESWAGQLAWLAAEFGIPFVFTSSTMVFDNYPNGPYTIDSLRTSTNDYGRYKIRCEDAIWASNPAAMVARLGYQIDPDGIGNNMVAHLDTQFRDAGEIQASTEWIPACSFMHDTATTLLDLLENPVRGLHHLDSNADDAWTYLEIVTALRNTLGREWSIVATTDPTHDQRMLGNTAIAPLSSRLTRLV